MLSVDLILLFACREMFNSKPNLDIRHVGQTSSGVNKDSSS